ncbi:hypothetical protein PIB30_064853 [Stylosanthes scabra]|uniref:Uncharacterized protein n=1 Tax=Stylosanthes scabra TaxID=79078 RepID=A0ABU6UMW4_9FABA|nr:hypothetical protein [Stylosanthes scabra]
MKLCTYMIHEKERLRSMKFGDGRSSPEGVTEEFIRNEGCPAQRARALIVTHPTVHTTSVEHVLAVRQPSDLVLLLEVREAHGAPLRPLHHLRELHHRKDLLYEKLRNRAEAGHCVIRVWFQQVREPHVCEDGANQLSYETQ